MPTSSANAVAHDDTRTLSSLAYLSTFLGLPILGPFIILVARGKEQPVVRWHAWQALLLNLFVVLGSILVMFSSSAVSILTAIFAPDASILVVPVSLLGTISPFLLGIYGFIAHIGCASRARRGSSLRLPIGARLADRLAQWKA